MKPSAGGDLHRHVPYRSRSGAAAGLADERGCEEIHQLRRGNFELRRANEIFKSASLFFARELNENRRSEPRIEIYWGRFGGKPICTVLGVSASPLPP